MNLLDAVHAFILRRERNPAPPRIGDGSHRRAEREADLRSTNQTLYKGKEVTEVSRQSLRAAARAQAKVARARDKVIERKQAAQELKVRQNAREKRELLGASEFQPFPLVNVMGKYRNTKGWYSRRHPNRVMS